MQVAIRVQNYSVKLFVKTTQSNSSRMGTIFILFGRLPQTLNQLHVGSNNGSLTSWFVCVGSTDIVLHALTVILTLLWGGNGKTDYMKYI